MGRRESIYGDRWWVKSLHDRFAPPSIDSRTSNCLGAAEPEHPGVGAVVPELPGVGAVVPELPQLGPELAELGAESKQRRQR